MGSSVNNINYCNIASYNLRGLNQGQPFLEQLMKTHNLILIQEHWLPPDDFFKLSKLNDDFLCLTSSAMGQKVSQNILVGRPFGGVGILYNHHLIKISCVFSEIVVL